MPPRYKTLTLTSMVLFSFYYVYDMPAALNKNLDLGQGYGAQKITLLYSVYALPNMILPLFFGWRTNLRFHYMGVFLCALVFIGQVLFSVGVYNTSFILMLVGRFIYGIGGESFTVIQNKIIAEKFKGKELAFSMSISTSIARCGTIFNYLITPFLAKQFGKSFSTTFGCFLTLVGLILCFCTIKERENFKFFKQRKTKINIKDSEKVENDDIILPENREVNENSLIEIKQNEEIDLNSYCKIIKIHDENLDFIPENELYDLRGGVYFPKTPVHFENDHPNHINISNISQVVQESDPWISNISLDEDIREEKPFTEISEINKILPATLRKKIEFEKEVNICTEKTIDSISASEIDKKPYRTAFSLLVGISFMFAVAWAPFSSVATIMFQKRYNITSISAGRLMAAQEGISLVLTIFVGYIADRFGFKLFLTMLGSLLLILAHCIIFLAYESSLIPIIILGISGPLISCYWPCITYLVSSDNLIKGFAIFTCILNIAYTFSPIMVSTLIKHDETYDTVEFFVISVSTMAFIFIIILGFLNSKLGLKLNRKAFL